MPPIVPPNQGNAKVIPLKRKTPSQADAARDYDVTAEWTEADLRLLNDLKEQEKSLPMTAPRVLISVRLSVFREETTSPVRQELDQRLKARDKGYRVIGVASDLNSSATKKSPWERAALGDWLKNRVPEYDVLMFWKLDRFVRSLSDLAAMIAWCEKYDKNLVSVNDPIDLSTAVGKIMVTILAGVAEIEATNTSVRVASTWQYTKTQDEWIIGKPPYGYFSATDAAGKRRLYIHPEESKALREAATRLVNGTPSTRLAKELREEGIMSADPTTLVRRLRNPGCMGYRVEEEFKGGARRSVPVLGRDGEPIRLAEPIFTEEEWDALQSELDKRNPGRGARKNNLTKFLGVIQCADCDTNMTNQRFTNKSGTYDYLRCRGCKAGGQGIATPDVLYDKIASDILEMIGHLPVEVREYARGEETRKRVAELEDRIGYYVKGLEPGGTLARTEFTRLGAEKALDALVSELESIDRAEVEDRWVNVAGGKTWREHWMDGGLDAMTADLQRVGARVVVSRERLTGQRQPRIGLDYQFPKDITDRLLIRNDDFGKDFS